MNDIATKRLEFIFGNGKKENLPPPTVDMYYKIYHAATAEEKIEGLTNWLASNNAKTRTFIEPADVIKAEILLTDWLSKVKSLESFKAPYYKEPGKTDEKLPYKAVFHELKTVSDYTGMGFLQLRELSLFTFWRYYKDAIIHNMCLSENGIEYLNKCYTSEQTKPDYAAIARLIAEQQQ